MHGGISVLLVKSIPCFRRRFTLEPPSLAGRDSGWKVESYGELDVGFMARISACGRKAKQGKSKEQLGQYFQEAGL